MSRRRRRVPAPGPGPDLEGVPRVSDRRHRGAPGDRGAVRATGAARLGATRAPRPTRAAGDSAPRVVRRRATQASEHPAMSRSAASTTRPPRLGSHGGQLAVRGGDTVHTQTARGRLEPCRRRRSLLRPAPASSRRQSRRARGPLPGSAAAPDTVGHGESRGPGPHARDRGRRSPDQPGPRPRLRPARAGPLGNRADRGAPSHCLLRARPTARRRAGSPRRRRRNEEAPRWMIAGPLCCVRGGT